MDTLLIILSIIHTVEMQLYYKSMISYLNYNTHSSILFTVALNMEI